MPVQPDFVKYHQSIADELKATQNRVRNLIGNRHWQTDGEHKESILRTVLRARLPSSLLVGRGFVCFREGPSTQIDILITDANKPTLFKDGDLVIVTPDCVKAVIEVKTKLDAQNDYQQALSKLADVAGKIRGNNDFGNALPELPHECWAGLFVFEEPKINKQDDQRQALHGRSQIVLRALSQSTGPNPERAINCISAGSDLFIRYWPQGTNNIGGNLYRSGWQTYQFERNHRGLAPAYFIGNLIMDIMPDLYPQAGYFWFPIQDQYGKEQYRLDCIEIGSNQIYSYPPA